MIKFRKFSAQDRRQQKILEKYLKNIRKPPPLSEKPKLEPVYERDVIDQAFETLR
jgi:hypothetical protein